MEANKVVTQPVKKSNEALKNTLRQYTMFIALGVVMIFFTIITGGTFMMPRNLSNLLLQTSHIAILACGVVLVIVAGHIDLSIGSVVGFTGAVAAVLQANHAWGTIPTVLVTLFVGALIGLFQGYWVAYQEVPAFIVTLAGMMGFSGGLLKITGGKTVAPMNDSFKAVSQNYLPNIGNAPIHITTLIIGVIAVLAYILIEARKRKERISYGFEVPTMNKHIMKVALVSVGIGAFFMIMVLYNGMPWVIVLVGIVALIYNFIANKTKFGRYVYAIGGNKEAAKLSGIDIKLVNLWIFISMGIIGAVGGIVYAARLNAATAASGKGMELEVIAAAIIGGTSTMGGEGTIMGAIIGALVMATLNNGMSLMGWNSDVQMIVKGIILLLAVWVDIYSRRAKK